MSPHSHRKRAVPRPQEVNLDYVAYLVRHNANRMANDDREGRSIYWAMETRRLVYATERLVAEAMWLRAELGRRDRPR